jgi:branched-chain amino acid transport system substrate-binding protein
VEAALSTPHLGWNGARVRATDVAMLLAAVVGISTVVMGCPHSGTPALEVVTPALRSADADAESDLRAADQAALDGRVAEARTGYDAFLGDHPDDPLVPLAHLGLGRIDLAEGDAQAALEQLDLARGSSDSVVEERASFHRGVALYLLGRHAEAIAELEPLRGQTTDPEDTQLLFETLASAAAHTGDHVLALSALDDLFTTSTTDAERETARLRARAIVEHELREDETERAYDELRHDRISWPLVAVAALRAAYEASDVAQVRVIATTLRAEHVDLTGDLAEIVSRAERIEHADPMVIGAILPLTGTGREIGQRALRGLVLASGAPADGPAPPGSAQLVFRDDAGDPERAARAVDELVSEHRAIAIVGPLEGPSATAAAARAQALGVPMITLSAREDVTSAGAMIFRLFPTLDGEARALVAAATARGAHRFAILRPARGYGGSMRDAYARAVTDAGGELVADESYDATATAFGPLVTRIAAQRPDAVLLADGPAKIALLAPALAAGGLFPVVQGGTAPSSARGIALLIPSVGFDERALHASSRYLQGASFSVPFYGGLIDAESRAFVDSFRARFGSDPDAFAAYAFDAFRIVRRAVEAGAQTRSDVATRLATMRDVPTAGASGGFDATRGATHAGRILVLRGETLAP